MDCSPPGSSVHGILQARVLEWVAIFFSRVLPDPGIEPRPPLVQADSFPTELLGKYMTSTRRDETEEQVYVHPGLTAEASSVGLDKLSLLSVSWFSYL